MKRHRYGRRNFSHCRKSFEIQAIYAQSSEYSNIVDGHHSCGCGLSYCRPHSNLILGAGIIDDGAFGFEAFDTGITD